MTVLFHYPDRQDTQVSILRDGLVAISARPSHPSFAGRSRRFALTYAELAQSVIGPVAPNSGVFFTTVDLRARTGVNHWPGWRVRLNAGRLASDWSVITWERDGRRTRLRLDENALRVAASVWTDAMVELWLGADPSAWFRFVPQVVTFQRHPVRITARDIDPAVD